VDWRSVKLRPRSSVAVVAIAKAAVCRRDTAVLAMAGRNHVDMAPQMLNATQRTHARTDGQMII